MAATAGPSVTPLRDTRLDPAALFFVSYDGLVNNNAFQRHGLLTFAGHQYAVWYDRDRHATVARRPKDSPDWQTARLPHRLSADDSHNVISAGVSPADGRIHLLMDSHSSGFIYHRSVAGLATEPSAHAWTAERFGAEQTSLGGARLTPEFTYPQFVVAPDGRLQLLYRAGVSGNGRAALAEYDGGAWTDLGAWSGSTGTYTGARGSSDARNLYVHGVDYGGDGRLHVFGTWRERSASVAPDGGLTNHDTVYVSSTDRGRTWRNAAGAVVGTTGGRPVGVDAPGIVVDPVDPDRALMNQESQCIDSHGRPHALVSHLPDGITPHVTGYAAARTAHARPFHLRRDATGGWQKTEIPFALNSSQRSQLVLDARDNAYAVMPYGRIAAASAASGWSDWAMLYDGTGALNAFGEVVVDRTRVRQDGVLSLLYQQRSAGTAPSPLRVIDFRLTG